MILYCEHISPRLRYIARFILNELLGMELIITNDPAQIKTASEPVLSYTRIPISDSFHVFPSGFISETEIRNFEPDIEFADSTPRLFPVTKSDFSFDIFSAVFYLISRYEEYLDFEPDIHGRFQAAKSYAFRNGFLEIPVVNIWIRWLSEALKEKFPELNPSLPGFHFMPTIDIDIAWIYKNKGLIRTAGSLGRLLLKGKFADSFQRLKVLQGKDKDPYDSYTYINQIHKSDDLRIFMLAGDGKKYNKNNPVKGKSWQKLTRDLSESYKVGLHPSYFSTEKPSLIHAEMQLMEMICGKKITTSRQHFLRLFFPGTYRRLLEIGIEEDYSMGYADMAGFRAGTSYPFFFYDLEREEETRLKIFPFQLMDRCMKDYMKLSPSEAVEKIREIIGIIRKEGGIFSPVWHNSSLGSEEEWNDWQEVYKEMLKMAGNKNIFYDQISGTG